MTTSGIDPFVEKDEDEVEEHEVLDEEEVPRPRSNKIRGRKLPSFEPKATMNINLREATGTIRGTYTREELSL